MTETQVVGLADVFEAFASLVPRSTAIVQGERRVSWADLDRRAAGIGAALIAAGLTRQDRVAVYLYNSPEYVEAFVAAAKAALVPVNTNYRYLDDELVHLWTDADAAAVVFHGTFVDTIERVRTRVPGVRLWLWVDDDTAPCPGWAEPYEQATSVEPARLRWPRSGDDLLFLYTGGTTGLPKGVMWRQRPLLDFAFGAEAFDAEAEVRAKVEAGSTSPVLPAPPLMHGTGIMIALRGLLTGQKVVLLRSRTFDPIELWDTVVGEGVALVAVVGDAFARSMLSALDDHPGRWDLSCLRTIMSAGAMFSEPVRRGLVAHMPHLVCVDQLSSSESPRVAVRSSRAGDVGGTGEFNPVPGVRVLDEAGNDIEPGSGRVGVLAVPGGAEGYHKDPEKTARVFPVIDGQRYTVAGDYATIEADGTVRLLGRGSVCINTGGEKVFPEEIEETLKTHPAVRDVVVVGVPDERFGEAIAALVEVVDGVDASDDEIIETVKARMARYKAPRHLIRVDSVGRNPNGKADYRTARAVALERLNAEPPTGSSRPEGAFA